VKKSGAHVRFRASCRRKRPLPFHFEPFDIKNITKLTAIIVYRIPQTGPNTLFGGVSGGFFKELYHSISIIEWYISSL
jgi:hypothetical protein